MTGERRRCVACRIAAARVPLTHLIRFLYRLGWSALHNAAEGGHLELVRLLVGAGADVNMGDM